MSDENVFIKPIFVDTDTKSGRFLRKTGLDKLPQLLNVLIGKIFFIKSRPLSLHDLNLLKQNENELYKKREVLNSPPGIFGYRQIFGNRNDGMTYFIPLPK